MWEIGKLSSICFIIWQLPSSIIIFSGSKERSQGRLKSPCKSSKEERRWRRRKGQKEEVVQGKNPRQIEQLGLVRQAYLRQTVERSSNLQTYHTFDCEWKIKGPWILGSQGFARTCPERWEYIKWSNYGEFFKGLIYLNFDFTKFDIGYFYFYRSY